ncbi:MAG: hypothetical protein GC180_00675 [Bacteroidetes bacterium]|nr:hypothetical protein [Bacteroidota bacterium]
MSKRFFPAVSTFSLKGKLLVGMIRIFGFALPLFYGRKPRKNFEENPAYYSWRDILYFAYKYYLHPPETAESEQLVRYFQTMQFAFPEGVEETHHLTLSTGGDLMPYAWMTRENSSSLWDEIGDWYFNNDVVFANLETPIDLTKPASAVPEVMLNDMHFNGNSALFDLFSGFEKFKGYDVLSTANNHSLDMEIEGIDRTIDFLQSKNILQVGTVKNSEDQFKPAIIEKNGIRLAFVAATYCLNHLELPENELYRINTGRFNLPEADISLIHKLVDEARKQADFVILSLHNGNAYQAYPSEHTVANVHRIFEECGPDLILGSHPHNPQPIEQYPFICPFTGEEKKGIAVYSQGDFVAYDIFTWCHLHLGIRFRISRFKDDKVRISRMEVMPQYLWHGDQKNGFDFRFLPLLNCEKYLPKMSNRSKMEYQEILRFWKTHLAPSLSSFATAAIP